MDLARISLLIMMIERSIDLNYYIINCKYSIWRNENA